MLPFRHNFHPAIHPIAHPTVQTQLLSFHEHKIAETNPLDPSFDPGMQSLV
jgi:hypothetical protein